MDSPAVASFLRAAVCAFLLLTGVALVPGVVQAVPLTVVSLTVAPAHIDDGQTSVFNVTVSGGVPPYSYNWSGLPPNQSWAPCIPANVSMLSCTAGVPGTFWIGVNVTDSARHTVAAGPVALTVAEPIGVSLDVTPRQGTVPLTVMFTEYGAGGTPPYTFQWIFGDGGQANVANTTHIYTVVGTYAALGCVGDSLQPSRCGGLAIRVFAPLAVMLVAQPANVTVLEATYLNATASGGLSNWTYTWSSLPPGCLPQNVPSLLCAPMAPGTYLVRVTVTDGLGETTFATVTLRVSSQSAPPGLTTPVWILVAAVIALGISLVALALLVSRMRPPRRP